MENNTTNSKRVKTQTMKIPTEYSNKAFLANGKKETILKIEGLHKSYGEKEVLKDLNFEVKNGQFISIIGSSGAGKSTLLRCINRMVEPTKGTITFKYDKKENNTSEMNKKIKKEVDAFEISNSNLTSEAMKIAKKDIIERIKGEEQFKYSISTQEIASASKKELREARKRLAMIFQHYNLVDRLSALENVLHGRLGHMSTVKGMLGLYEQPIVERAQRLLDQMGIKDQTYKKCSDLSGGQKQRVGIARGLIQHPNLMLCDEPIASLDPVSSVQIMQSLRDIAKDKNVPCLVNLHQVDMAKKYSDRIIGINSGRILFDGTPEELTQDIIDQIYKGDESHATSTASK